MSTLDLAQHIYLCRDCRHPAPASQYPYHPSAVVSIEPTLLYVDFAAYLDARRVAGENLPADHEVWDRLESHTDTAATNREAIDNAIKAVRR